MSKPILRYLFSALLCTVLLLNLASCQKKDMAAPVTEVTEVRTVGTPVGDMLSVTIGPDGGTVVSEDGRVEVLIPQNALTEDAEIGIQALKNTSLSGVSYGYRLTPHGKIFKKKVTVRFHYDKNVSQLSNLQALEIAYQNDKGIWTCVGGAVNDTIQKTISVQTEHFSDWALIASMELTPTVKTLGLSETVTLRALHYLPKVNDADLLIPLTIPDAATGVPTPLGQQYIVKWTLSGPGKLEVKGNEAIYTSPSSRPAQKTATVTVELNVHGKRVLLISTIHIIDEGISLSIDYGDWHTYPATAVLRHGPDLYGIVSQRVTTDIPQIVITWPVTAGQNANGMYNWSSMGEPANRVMLENSDPSIRGIYSSVFEKDNEMTDSGGYMTAEEITVNGKKYLTGSFVVTNSGVIDYATGKQKSVSYIMGTYKVQRNW